MFKFNSRKYGGSSYADKKKRNRYLKLGGLVLVTVAIVVGAYQFFILKIYAREVRESTITEITSDNSGYVTAYILTDEVKQGDPIDEKLLSRVEKESSQVPDNCIKDLSSLKNTVARIHLSKNTVITGDMLIDMQQEISDVVKNQDFNWIKIHAFLEKGNYVDIHYKQLDGTDNVVAAKKKVINLSGSIFSTNITDLEREYINNATVRAAVTGGELYTTIYPDPENQNPAEVTYALDRTIQAAIDKDSSIINKSEKTLTKSNEITSTATKQEKPNFNGGGN